VATYNNIAASAILTVLPSEQAAATHTPVAICASLALLPCVAQSSHRVIKPLGVQDGGPPPPTSPTLFERQYTFYTPELSLLSETTASSNGTPVIAYDYIWFGGQPLAQIENATGNIAWYFNDQLGTPIRQTDATGRVLWQAEYEPYGTIYAIRRGESRHQPLRFPGQTAEEGSDLYQNVFRFYRARWGRYTEVDPLGLAPDMNLYRYALGNPVVQSDALGLDTIGCDSVPNSYDTPCRLECCAQHDKCYDENHCSSGSWGAGSVPWKKGNTTCDYTSACKDCNVNVLSCFKKCGRSKYDDPKKPNYYCGSQHRFVTISGDFKDKVTAEKACECDYSKGCTLSQPSKPSKPIQFPGIPHP
jgi:RHS repeat-associated protein